MGHSLIIERIDALIRIFLYILIFWLPYSPAVIESCVVICLILWLLKHGIMFSNQSSFSGTLKEKIYRFLNAFKPRSTFLNKPVSFFLLACILSVTSSAFFAQSLHNFLTKTLEWFIVYFLVVEVFKDKKHIYIALGIFLFTAFSTAIDSLIQFYITNKDIFNGRVIEPASRATAGFKTSNLLGAYLTAIIPGVFGWVLLVRQKLNQRIIVLGILIIMIWSLGVSFSRGAYIGTFLGGMLVLIFAFLPKKRRYIYIASGFLLTTTILFISIIFVLANSSGQEMFGRYATIPWRLDLWMDSFKMIKDKPIFGHGVNTFMGVFQVYRGNLFMDPTYAHNCYIQLAAEIGIVGLCSFIWIVAAVFHQVLKRIIHNFTQNRSLAALAVGLLSGIFAFLVHSFFDTNIYSLQLSVYLWYMVGMLVVVCKIIDATSVKRG